MRLRRLLVIAISCVFVFLGVATAPSEGSGCPAPYPYPFQIGCEQGSCVESATIYVCSGSLQNGQTCGAPCTGSIRCCGQVVSYEPMWCDATCAGCKPTDRKLAEGKVPRMGRTSEIATPLADRSGNASSAKPDTTTTRAETAATSTKGAAPARTVGTLVDPSGGNPGAARE